MGDFRPVSVLPLLLCFCVCTVQSTTIVKHLPGYKGPLPFYLETGYVTVDEANGGELFYYFIESEGNPSEDPLLLWLTGGNRCSALSGLLFEIGPLKIVKAQYNGSLPELEYHPYAWTKNASIIFLDCPLGAGFSYSSNPKGYEVNDTVTTLQIHKFLMQWFVDHSNYLVHPFYVAGDSLAAKIVPVVAQLISEGIEAGQQPLLNLKGYLVGNPSTGEIIDDNSRVPYAHGVGIISDQLFEGKHLMIYSGDHDLVVPFLGTQAWVRSLNFPVVDAWRAWHVNGQTAGFRETYSNNLTFATIRNGGHTAPEYRPVECLAMFERWISNQPL